MLSSLLEEHESPGTSAGSTPDSQQGFIAPPAIPQISLLQLKAQDTDAADATA